MEAKKLFRNLDRLYDKAHELPISNDSRIVIFSDTHMGDGSSSDDYKSNSILFETVLKDYYLKKGFKLILNGDIEEVQRYSFKKIYKTWNSTYKILDEFHSKEKLIKTIGNHDLQLATLKEYPYDLYDSVKLDFDTNQLFVFHGHQASNKYDKNNDLVGLSLKYFANPLGIKNFSVAHNSRKQFKIERRVYRYSNYKKVASIIGHTHRPLFESLSKSHRLRFKIEQLCRDYLEATREAKDLIKGSIKVYKKELKFTLQKDFNEPSWGGLYNSFYHVPSLFNSGCVIGKRGITCLEIRDGDIALIHWFDKNISKKYLRNTGYDPESLGKTDFYRMVLNIEELDYVFARIRFLS